MPAPFDVIAVIVLVVCAFALGYTFKFPAALHQPRVITEIVPAAGCIREAETAELLDRVQDELHDISLITDPERIAGKAIDMNDAIDTWRITRGID
jgi:hypothetical protein